MADVEITYNNNTIVTMSDSGTEILETEGTFLTDDITVQYTKPTPTLQSKSATPTESAQTITPDSGYDGLSQVSVGAISSSYVGSNVPRQAAQTITPTTSDQTIASGKYLTGTQTILGDQNLVAGNIKKDVVLFGVTGTLEEGITPTGVKYAYTDIDGMGAYNVSGYEKVSVDYADLSDDKFRLWVQIDSANTEYSFSVSTGGLVVCHIDWGDGNEENVNSGGSSPATQIGTGYVKSISHTYSNTGRYCIVISSTNNLIAGVNSSSSFLKGVEVASYINGWYSANYFSNAQNLERITFPVSNTDTSTVIGASCCTGCQSLKTVVFNSQSSAIPSFKDCTSLEEITLPNTVGALSGSLFYGCTNLIRVNGFEHYTGTILSQYIFRNCSSLRTLTIPTSITTFQNSVFESSGLTTITIPENVTNMGRYTFQHCIYLTEVHMRPTTPPTIYAGMGYSADPFGDTHPNLVIYVPSGYLSAYTSASNWSSYSSIMREETV